MSRAWRPVLVGAIVVVVTFALAQAQIFEPSAPAQAVGTGGDIYRGETVFQRDCASCHGSGGEGGGIAPRLADTGLDAVEVAATIRQGAGVMPPALVSGRDEADVVAYVVGIAQP
ncbi:MAG: cytochrome c [Gaiellaceae bacterium]